ncbi:MAG: hypothetical protein Q8P67_27060 [archaeon]|nr:hypothetical protein [archaeon]
MSSNPTESNVVNHNLDAWYEANIERFQPPVCNCLMFRDQLKVMYVTGPNIRKDYHLELGEELFFQVRGSMVVEAWERGRRKPVEIKEGEVFVLPARVPHSPQRFAGTLGLVVERERLPHEMDSLRYYVEGGGKDDLLFQASFHCFDLGTQLKPVIAAYFASEEHRTGKPNPQRPVEPSPVPVDEEVTLHQPFSLREAVEERIEHMRSGGGFCYVFDEPEFKVRARISSLPEEAIPFDKMVWVLAGTCSLTSDGVVQQLKAKDHCLVRANVAHAISIDDPECRLLEIWMEPRYLSNPE